jgi:hypothetical protein
MVKGKHAKELVGLAHTNMLTALGNADPNDTERCYGIINNLFQILRLEDFYTELEQVQGEPGSQKPAEYEPSNVTPFPAVTEQTEVAPDSSCPDVVKTTQEKPTVTATHTREEVRDLLKGAAVAGKNVKGLLTKYGVDKLSDLNEETYDAIYADAEALMSEE